MSRLLAASFLVRPLMISWMVLTIGLRWAYHRAASRRGIQALAFSSGCTTILAQTVATPVAFTFAASLGHYRFQAVPGVSSLV